MTSPPSAAPPWPAALPAAAAFLVATLLLLAGLHEGVQWMVNLWLTTEEYSHGLLVPLVAAFLALQRLPGLRAAQWHGAWAGLALAAAGLAIGWAGSIGSVFVLQQYALIVVLAGLVLSLGGWPMLARLKAPLLVLVLMVPLPNFFSNNLSLQLQLLSSQLGVWFIRAFGISVYLEGNVIDLGIYKLQVAEACSGLRYLFPLLTVAFVVACFYRVAAWKRVLLVLVAIPLTVGMNSLRIGTIGFMVDRWGPSLAEGAVHEFQGWLMFMLCAALLLALAWALARVSGDRRPWREVFDLSFAPPPQSARAGGDEATRAMPAPFLLAAALVMVAGAALWLTPRRAEAVPARQPFIAFPMQLGAWQGTRSTLDAAILDTLQLDDYLMADYRMDGGQAINFYVAWYNSQRSGQSAHSPRSCLPGGGWKITRFDQRTLADVRLGSQPLRVNRALIEQGENRALVYYFFKQRDRDVTSEYAVKWWLFRDAIGRNRTDGALVRLVRNVAPGEDLAAADAQMQGFAREAMARLGAYVPD